VARDPLAVEAALLVRAEDADVLRFAHVAVDEMRATTNAIREVLASLKVHARRDSRM